MTHTTCKMMWFKNLMMKLGFKRPRLMPMHCDSQFAIYITQNLVFHERTKHIEINYHLVRNALTKGGLSPVHIIFKAVGRSSYQSGFTSGVFKLM